MLKILEYIMKKIEVYKGLHLDKTSQQWNDQQWNDPLKILKYIMKKIELYKGSHLDKKSQQWNDQQWNDLQSLISCVEQIKKSRTVARMASYLNMQADCTESEDTERIYQALDILNEGASKVVIENLRRKVARPAINRFRNFASGPTLTEGNWEEEEEENEIGNIWALLRETEEESSDYELNAEWDDKGTDEERLMKIMKNFSEWNLREGSLFSNIFSEDLELVHFDDRYQDMVRSTGPYRVLYDEEATHKLIKLSLMCRNACTPSSSTKSRRLSPSFFVDPLRRMIGNRTSRLIKTTQLILWAKSRPRLGSTRASRTSCFESDGIKTLADRRHDMIGSSRRWKSISKTRTGGMLISQLLVNSLVYVLIHTMHSIVDLCRLCVTGHSLGGALATLFGFYAATDDRIIKNGQPVELYTFASPLVGDQNFRQAFKALETKGKIVHARICNEGDLGTSPLNITLILLAICQIVSNPSSSLVNSDDAPSSGNKG
jgi:hypothetical protein